MTTLFEIINLILWNVQGLTNLTRKYSMWDTRYLNTIDIDVSYFWKIKITNLMLGCACHVICPTCQNFASKYEVGRGSVITLLLPCWKSSILASWLDFNQ